MRKKKPQFLIFFLNKKGVAGHPHGQNGGGSATPKRPKKRKKENLRVGLGVGSATLILYGIESINIIYDTWKLGQVSAF
jgi:hypothetical protein